MEFIEHSEFQPPGGRTPHGLGMESRGVEKDGPLTNETCIDSSGEEMISSLKRLE